MLLVHLTSSNNRNSVLRSGIKPRFYRQEYPKGVFAMPIIPDFYISHQWLRELKRSGQRNICGVYFRIPDEQEVYVGHYNRQHLHTTVAEAAGMIMEAKNSQGYEVFIPRKIAADEIKHIKALPQVLGWRYYPEAHGKKPCGCPVCLLKGEIKSRKIRQAWEEG
ncbi:hypothetical protein [Nostoc sp. CMAA1605]|uniref:hypothetical protein n=1 Tax=Nostoc sp. CMAA1605 TaxID=2055159 RepID=UPI001F3B9F50|nr:hypothetical protein [Nostoc sp. CMAA1605]